MRKSTILLGATLVFGVAAASPKMISKLAYDDSVLAGYAQARTIDTAGYPAARTYRPCRSRSDDNCIQLYERSVREAMRRSERLAMGGPIEGAAAYPECSRLITDECVQRFDRAPRPARRAAPPRRPVAPEELDTPGI